MQEFFFKIVMSGCPKSHINYIISKKANINIQFEKKLHQFLNFSWAWNIQVSHYRTASFDICLAEAHWWNATLVTVLFPSWHMYMYQLPLPWVVLFWFWVHFTENFFNRNSNSMNISFWCNSNSGCHSTAILAIPHQCRCHVMVKIFSVQHIP